MISSSGNTCVKNAGAPTRYGAVAQTLHWLTAILVLGAYLSSVGGPESRIYSDALEPTRRLHETLGLAVFAVVALRLIWRVFDRRPAEPTMPRWMALASRVTQFALYMLLVAVPVTAIVGAWCEGHPLTLLGAIGAGPWHALSANLGRTLTQVHTTLGNVILWVAGLHAAAALFHHFVLQDTVLRSMLPVRPTLLRANSEATPIKR
jgi:cytochrome b561